MTSHATTIVIRCGEIFLSAELNDSETARKVAGVLPITSEVGCWGGEIFFEVPVVGGLADDAREVMQPGEIAFWPPGRAVCVFWGRTPSSRGEEIRAASPVNPIGRVTGGAGAGDSRDAMEAVRALAAAKQGDTIVVERN